MERNKERRNYSREFKEEAVKMVTEGGRRVTEVCVVKPTIYILEQVF